MGRNKTFFTQHPSRKTALTTVGCRALATETQGVIGRGGLKTEELHEELSTIWQPFGKLGLRRVSDG